MLIARKPLNTRNHRATDWVDDNRWVCRNVDAFPLDPTETLDSYDDGIDDNTDSGLVDFINNNLTANGEEGDRPNLFLLYILLVPRLFSRIKECQ